MKTSKRKVSEQQEQTTHSQKLPPTPEQIRQRAYDIYIARGGAEGTALDDWLKAEQELKQGLE